MPGGDKEYSRAELEEIVSKRVSDKLTEALVDAIKTTVNGLQTHVDQLGRDVQEIQRQLADQSKRRMQTAREIASEIGVFILSTEDRKVLDVMIEDYKQKIRRGVWYQTVLGRIALIAGIAAALATVIGTFYLVFAGTSHPLKP